MKVYLDSNFFITILLERENESNIKVCRWNYVINNKLIKKSDPIVIILRSKKRIGLLTSW